MSITAYDPDDTYTAGNTVINVMPAVADGTLEKVTVAEWAAGTMIQCATEEFSQTTDASTTTRKKICDRIATQKPGDRTYQAGDTVIVAADPQAANPLLETLALDSIHYVSVRPGLDDKTAATAGQKLWTDKRQVLSVDPEPINTEEGNSYQWRIKWLVLGRSYESALSA